MSRFDIVFIRHGWSEGNEKRLLYGRLDVPLMPRGIEILKEYREKYDYPETERYYSSPLIRARETFETLYPGKKLDGILDGFIEMSFGDVEGYPESYAESYKAYFKRWSAGETLWNGEPLKAIRARTEKAVRELLTAMHDDGVKSATVVSHSCTMKSILMNSGFMTEDFMSVFIHQGMGFQITYEFDGRNIEIIGKKDIPIHMEKDGNC